MASPYENCADGALGCFELKNWIIIHVPAETATGGILVGRGHWPAVDKYSILG